MQTVYNRPRLIRTHWYCANRITLIIISEFVWNSEDKYIHNAILMIQVIKKHFPKNVNNVGLVKVVQNCEKSMDTRRT